MAHPVTQYINRISNRSKALLLIVSFALVLRLILAFGCTALPDFSDMERYNLLALRGGISIVPPPGYPLFLRAIYGVFGPRNYLAVFIIQGIISAMTVGLIFLVAERVANLRTAVIAGVAATVFPNFLVYNLVTMSESLGLLFAVLIMYLMVSDKSDVIKAVAGALLLVAACAVRPVLIFFWPGMLAALKKRIVFIAATILLVSPWVIYSASVEKVTNRPGRAFYKTYNPESNGKQYVAIEDTPLASKELPNAVYFREAFDFIIHNRWKTVNIIYNKAAMIFSRGWDQHFMERIVRNGSFWGFVMIYAFIPVMLLGTAGVITGWDVRNRILAYMLISYLAFFILISIFKVRYRLLVEPIFIIFGALFVDRLIAGSSPRAAAGEGEAASDG